MNLHGELVQRLDEKLSARLKFAETAASFSIDIVLVPAAHRGSGVGSALMQRVLLLADALGKDVHLTARPIGTSGAEALTRLIRYYERFGFEVCDRGLTTARMRRPPTRRGNALALE